MLITKLRNNLYQSHLILDNAVDSIQFLGIWQNLLIETFAGIWIQKVCEYSSLIDNIDDFLNEIKILIKGLSESNQKKLTRFNIEKTVSKIFSTIKPLNQVGAIWYASKHLLRNKHMLIENKDYGSYILLLKQHSFVSTRDAPFNLLQDKDYQYLKEYLDYAQADQTETVHFYPPQRYLDAHNLFWETHFQIINPSQIVNSGKGLSTKNCFIPENVLGFYSGYLYRGKESKLSVDEISRALCLRKNRLYIIAMIDESLSKNFPSMMNYYYTSTKRCTIDFNHFKIITKCDNQSVIRGKNSALGFIISQIALKPNTECFLQYNSFISTQPVNEYNQVLCHNITDGITTQYRNMKYLLYSNRHPQFYSLDLSHQYASMFKLNSFIFDGTGTNSIKLDLNGFISPLQYQLMQQDVTNLLIDNDDMKQTSIKLTNMLEYFDNSDTMIVRDNTMTEDTNQNEQEVNENNKRRVASIYNDTMQQPFVQNDTTIPSSLYITADNVSKILYFLLFM